MLNIARSVEVSLTLIPERINNYIQLRIEIKQKIIIRNQVFLLLFFTSLLSYSQNKDVESRKGDITVLWGWNRGWYSNSDIHFSGETYDFILDNVIGKDRQTKFDPAIYFHPKWITIPQTNLRIGYFIKDNYEISIGDDHMKYVVQQNQDVRIDGQIQNTGTNYDGIYNNDTIKITNDFLQFEHTDGLNYINIEFRRVDNILSYKDIDLNISEGIGIGLLLPKTNSSLLNNERYDQFHVSGYGFNSVISINLSHKGYFIQSELKGGFINMSDVRTTNNSNDKARHSFFFAQANFLIGKVFRFD